MDSSITPLRHGGLSLVQTTDFFYPLVEDPYMQGNLILASLKKKVLNFVFLMQFMTEVTHSYPPFLAILYAS